MNADELQAAANAAYVKAAPGHMVVASGLQAAIDVAVAAERKRCAKVAREARCIHSAEPGSPHTSIHGNYIAQAILDL